MDFFDSIGYVAAFCTTVSFLPQVLKVLKTGDTQSLSLGMYITFVMGVALWFVYGVAKLDSPIIIANALTLLFASTILVIKIKGMYKKSKKERYP